MAKPNKNRVLCPDCGRQKMLFDTEKKAELFIKFNGTDITDDVSKLRVYYCPACCGYHISSHKKSKFADSRTERLIEAYKKDIEVINPHKEILLETNEKLDPYVDEIKSKYYSIYYRTTPLDKWVKENYSDVLSGEERNWVCQKVKYLKKYVY